MRVLRRRSSGTHTQTTVPLVTYSPDNSMEGSPGRS